MQTNSGWYVGANGTRKQSKIYYRHVGSQIIKNIEVPKIIAEKMAMVLGDLVEVVEIINY